MKRISAFLLVVLPFSANAAAARSQLDALGPVVATLVILGVMVAIRATYKFFRTPTLPKYVQKYPHAHSATSGVKCAHCGSSSIFLSFVFGEYGPKTHMCRGCGRVLYRS